MAIACMHTLSQTRDVHVNAKCHPKIGKTNDNCHILFSIFLSQVCPIHFARSLQTVPMDNSAIRRSRARTHLVQSGTSTLICKYQDYCLLKATSLNCLFFTRYLGKNDCLTITVWNQKKVHKKQGAGFLGCVKILPSLIQSLKDTSCK